MTGETILVSRGGGVEKSQIEWGAEIFYSGGETAQLK